MSANAKNDRQKRCAVPAERFESPAAPSSAVPMLRHLQSKRKKSRLEAMNVRVPESTLAALDRYLRHHGVAKQDVVTDMLEHMLTISGFSPAVD